MEPRRRFRFLKKLSEGTFGKVYMAEMLTDNNFSSVVAIKLLHGKWLGHEEIVQRSRDEARVLGLLHHRNIIRVEDLTSLNGQCAVIMEYLDGVDLKSLINYCAETNRQIPRRVVFELVAATASALEAAYYREPLRGGEPLQLIHRDIKPSNVMVTAAGDIKVLDFGTAQARFENREAKTQALAFGSQAYMAPERLLGDPDAPSGDIFSLGVTLYELLTLEPFGKIHIRPERYDKGHQERMEKLDLSDLDEVLVNQIRQTLNLLLTYEATERPDARQVLDLMEALSEEIHDGSMRRFCREFVKPCRDRLVAGGSPNDPLAGSTLFEDVSGIRGDWASAVAPVVADPSASGGFEDGSVHTSDPPPPPPATSTMPIEDISAGLPDPGAPAAFDAVIHDEPTQEEFASEPVEPVVPVKPELVAEAAEPVVEAPKPPIDRSPPPVDFFAQTISPSLGTQTRGPRGLGAVTPSAERPPPPKEKPSSGGGIGKWIVLGLLFMVVFGGGAVVVVLNLLNQPDVVEPPPPPDVVDATREGIPGQRIEFGPVGPDAGTVILRVEGSVTSVKIRSSNGDYKETWDGTDELELVGLSAGVYKTTIKANKSTRTTIESVPDKTCRYTYKVDQGGDEWESDCE